MLSLVLLLLLLPQRHECVVLATEESVAETGTFAGVVPLKYETELDIQRPDYYEGKFLLRFVFDCHEVAFSSVLTIKICFR